MIAETDPVYSLSTSPNQLNCDTNSISDTVPTNHYTSAQPIYIHKNSTPSIKCAKLSLSKPNSDSAVVRRETRCSDTYKLTYSAKPYMFLNYLCIYQYLSDYVCLQYINIYNFICVDPKKENKNFNYFAAPAFKYTKFSVRKELKNTHINIQYRDFKMV